MRTPRLLSSAALVGAIVTGACGDVDRNLDEATSAIAQAYCEGMAGCCMASGRRSDLASCIAKTRVRVEAELRESLRGDGDYAPDRLAGCAGEVRQRAAQCITHDNSYARGITKTARLYQCGMLASARNQSCPCQDDWQCVGAEGTELHGISTGPHCIPPSNGPACDFDLKCESPGVACVVNACDDGRGKHVFTGYEVGEATCGL